MVTTVLTNILEDRSNPWLSQWLAAQQSVGIETDQLTWRSVIQRAGRGVAVHLQWPERMVSAPRVRGAVRQLTRLLALLLVARCRRWPVLLSMHNNQSHDPRHATLERALWAALGWLVTDVHVFAAAGRADVEHHHPQLARKRWHHVPHGRYDVVDDTSVRVDVRRQLGVSEAQSLLLCFGSLRGYKGVDELVSAFSGRTSHPDAVLVIAGRTESSEEAARLQESVRSHPDIKLLLGYLPQAELERLIGASDSVVLPYRQILTSGSAMLALSCSRPVILPRSATFGELASLTGDGWVKLYDGAIGGDAFAPTPHRTSQPDLSWADWGRLSRSIELMWRRAIDPR